MTTHLQIRNGFTELDTFHPMPEDLINIDFDFVNDFDYVLATIEQIVAGPAFEWDGVQTMRLILMLAKGHLEVHGELTEFNFTDVEAIRAKIEEG